MTLLDSAAPDPIKNSSDKSFMADVIEQSRETPVVVDFWAPWCGPCKQLAPALEQAVRAAKGKVRLVKINIDENPAIAGQLGVRSIPAVFAFDKGRPVDGFTGVVPASQIKMFVERLAGAGAADDAEALLAEAAESLKLGDLAGAAQGYAGALQVDAANTKAIAGLARVYLAGGQADQAREILEMTPPDKANDPEIAGVRAALELAAGAPDDGETQALMAKLDQNPNDHQARFDLAGALAARGDLEAACDQLFTIMKADRAWNDEGARKQLLKIFEATGPTSDIAKTGRRRLSALLFS